MYRYSVVISKYKIYKYSKYLKYLNIENIQMLCSSLIYFSHIRKNTNSHKQTSYLMNSTNVQEKILESVSKETAYQSRNSQRTFH